MPRRAWPASCCLLCLLVLVGPATGRNDRARRVLARVTVRGDGFVRLEAREWKRLVAGRPDHVRVERRGEAVPMAVHDVTGDIVFLASNTIGRHTADAVFEIVAEDEPPARAPRLSAKWTQTPADPAGLPCEAVDAEDRLHGPLGAGRSAVYAGAPPTWYRARLEPGGTTEIPLSGGRVVGDQTLRAGLRATYLGPIALSAKWAGVDLGLAKAEQAAGEAVLTWRVPAHMVPAGEAVLTLRNLSPPLPPGPPNDLSPARGRLWVDRVTLAGARVPVLDASTRTYRIGGAREVYAFVPPEASRRPALFVLDASRHLVATITMPGDGSRGSWLRIDAGDLEGAMWLVASGVTRDAHPSAARAGSDPLAQAGSARHVILAVPQLVEPARELAAHRTRHGLPSAVVDVRDVYDAYAYGEQDPAAIGEFVRRLRARAEAPLQYLLLAGDAIRDRTDLSSHLTIPAPMRHTMWNGATPCDRDYVAPDGDADPHAPVVGRLPFRHADAMRAYVRRLVAQEETPVPDPHRGLLRFLAGGIGMGPMVDTLFERAFRKILDEALDPALYVEVTYASGASPFFWPVHRINEKVVADLGEGCLYYTYVGHGMSPTTDGVYAWDGDLSIFTEAQVPEVHMKGIKPLMIALASGSAAYDLPRRRGLGEALIANPDGPLVYWGATRLCNPVFNCLIARGLARHVSGARRVGDLLRGAYADVLGEERDPWKTLVLALARGRWPEVQQAELIRDGIATYTLLGDPATAIPLPRRDLEVSVARGDRALDVTVRADLPDGTKLHVRVLRQRNDTRQEPAPAPKPYDPASEKQVMDIHRRVNDREVAAADGTLHGRVAHVRVDLPEGRDGHGDRVVVQALAGGDVHTGAVVLE